MQEESDMREREKKNIETTQHAHPFKGCSHSPSQNNNNKTHTPFSVMHPKPKGISFSSEAS